MSAEAEGSEDMIAFLERAAACCEARLALDRIELELVRLARRIVSSASMTDDEAIRAAYGRSVAFGKKRLAGGGAP